MKKLFLSALSSVCAIISVFTFTACDNSVAINATVLGKPSQKITELSYLERTEKDFADVYESAERFAADFASLAFRSFSSHKNIAVSPISVYMAMSLAAQCSAGKTQSQILSTLGISYENLNAQFSDYYRSVIAEYTDRGEADRKLQTGMISLSNSIWLDSHTVAKQDCIDVLSDKFFCYSYQTEFADDNKTANECIRQFVRQNTKGLIDKDFRLSESTVFTLINTLYLKDVWNTFGNDLTFTDSYYDFVQSDGNIKNTKLLNGYYNIGRAVDGDGYITFFTKTENGNRIDFILPENGHTVGDVFTAENIKKVKSITSYNGVDHDKKQRFYTRCLFPEFKASYDERIKPILSQMGITALFDAENCDFSALTDSYVYCEDVIHTTELKVDRKGIEGAAVTALPMGGATGPDGYEQLYEDFIIDRAFGFIISDSYGNTLFSGAIENI